MAVRIKDGIIPYTGGQGIEITDNHVINVLLREMNNLIHVNGDRELYVDLQLPSGIKPTDTFPVGVTTGKILQADGWQQSGLILNRKTTSGDYARLIYANDGKLYIDKGNGVWVELEGGGEGGCKVHISEIPSVGDDITDLVDIAMDDSKVLVFCENTVGIAQKTWYTVNAFYPDDGYPGLIQAIGLGDRPLYTESLEIKFGGSGQEFECTSVERKRSGESHRELILDYSDIHQDQVDSGLIVANVGIPPTGTVLDLTFNFSGGTLERASFNGGYAKMNLVYPCGHDNGNTSGTTPRNEFDMSSASYTCRLTGIVVNGKVYVWDFSNFETGA